jgi:heme exporter protein C
MKGWWWKLLSVLILLYTFTAGLLVPLKAGIEKVTPDSAEGGRTLTLSVTGYNTSFQKDETGLRAWLKLDEEHVLAARAVQAVNPTLLQATFAIPATLDLKPESYFLSLLLDAPSEGSIVLPDAVYLKPSSVAISPKQPDPAWKAIPEGLHAGMRLSYPYRNLLAETIRNTYFHVPLWFGMILILLVSVIYSIRYLTDAREAHDQMAAAFTATGIVFGLLGLATGAVWARYTWGSFWSWDIKQIVSAVALLIYMAYFVLRNSFEDEEQKARLGAVYNIFAFAALIPLLFVIPRLNSVGVSLHPGNGGNPGFGGEDLDNTMRMVFYPAIIGWTLLGVWMATLWARYYKLLKWSFERDF